MKPTCERKMTNVTKAEGTRPTRTTATAVGQVAKSGWVNKVYNSLKLDDCELD